MEIKLLRKELPIWTLEKTGVKKTQFSADSVVPDTIEDVKSIVFGKGRLLLKEKEPGKHGTKVSGEACAALLLLTETGRLETFRLERPFELDFEVQNTDQDALPQITWSLSGMEARLLNPRKLSVSFEVGAELVSFRRGSLSEAVSLPEGEPHGLHLLLEESSAMVVSSVTEKPFTLRQQLELPAGESGPETIAGEELSFQVQGTEQIGSRCIVKGELLLKVWGLNGQDLPAGKEFRLPFSQLVDVDDQQAADCIVSILPSSVYLDWSEGIDDRRILDAEIHAVLQLCLYSRRSAVAVTDAYSSQMPVSAGRTDRVFLSALERGSCLLRAEERLPIPEDMAELLSSELNLGPLMRDREKSSVSAAVDLLYRTRDGMTETVRRSFVLCGETLPEGAESRDLHLRSFDLALQEGFLQVSCEADLDWTLEKVQSVSEISDLQLDTENAWKSSELPLLTVVRRGEDSLWNLAREYRSSVELITACNEKDAEMLLIPAEQGFSGRLT